MQPKPITELTRESLERKYRQLEQQLKDAQEANTLLSNENDKLRRQIAGQDKTPRELDLEGQIRNLERHLHAEQTHKRGMLDALKALGGSGGDVTWSRRSGPLFSEHFMRGR